MNRKDLEHLINEPIVKFKEEEVNGEAITIVSYMIKTDDFFKIPLSKECRGITFNSNGDIICRPFEVFFNLNERPETQLKVVEKWNWNDVTVFEKRDGSMVSPVVVNGEVCWKTKKSFYSDVALDCQRYAEELNILSNGEFYKSIKDYAEIDQTLIFEFTSPNNKIVLDYGSEPQLVLLAVRDTVSGVYSNPEPIAKILNVPSIQIWNKTLDEILSEVDTKKDFEGYVLFNKRTQERVKIKTKWYLEMHRINTEIRERDIVSMILNETVDDMKSLVVSNGLSIEPILEIERNVTKMIDTIIESTLTLASVGKTMDRKSFAIEYKHHSHFGLAIKEIDGKYPDYKGYFLKRFLQTFSLKNVYNTNFGKQDEQ